MYMDIHIIHIYVYMRKDEYMCWYVDSWHNPLYMYMHIHKHTFIYLYAVYIHVYTCAYANIYTRT